MSHTLAIPSLFLILMGTLDCLTTLIGTVYFRASELNPLIAALLNLNVSVFVIVKLAVTFIVGLVFILANKTLLRIAVKESSAYKIAHRTLRVASYGIVIFLGIVVLNNIFVLLKIIW